MMKKTRNVFHLQAKKCKRSDEKIKKNKLLNACLTGECNILSQIKYIRKPNQ